MSEGSALCSVIDPQGHGQIGAHYFQAWCPSVRKNKHGGKQNMRYDGHHACRL